MCFQLGCKHLEVQLDWNFQHASFVCLAHWWGQPKSLAQDAGIWSLFLHNLRASPHCGLSMWSLYNIYSVGESNSLHGSSVLPGAQMHKVVRTSLSLDLELVHPFTIFHRIKRVARASPVSPRKKNKVNWSLSWYYLSELLIGVIH